MTIITIKDFGGKAPRINPRKLADHLAQTAQNARLLGKDLRAFRDIDLEASLAKTGDIQTIYLYNNNTAWLHWTQDVDVARIPIGSDVTEKIVFTGTDAPRITNNLIYDDNLVGTFRLPDSYVLGIPKPNNIATAALGAAGNITGTGLSWVYTYVRVWADGTTDEGPPSDPSTPVISPTAQQVTVGMSNAGSVTFADYGITHKRIYRTVSGTAGADYEFVGQFTVATVSTSDNIATANLGEVLSTTLYLPPPATAKGVIALQNGVMAMFVGNILYLSEPYKPHAYPIANQYIVNFPIVGLGFYNKTTIAVLTNGNPWEFYGTDPAAMTPHKFDPIQSCSSKRSIVSDEMGVRWASPDGISKIHNGQWSLSTKDIFTKDEWADYYISTIHATSFDNGRYLAFYQTGLDVSGNHDGMGFLFDETEGDPKFVDLTTYGYALHRAVPSGKLYIVQRDETTLVNKVYEWEGSAINLISFDWKSKQFVTAADDNFAYGIVYAEYGAGLSPAEQAAYTASRNAIIAANQTSLSSNMADSFNGPYFNEDEFNGDNILTEVPPATFVTGTINFRLYIDSELVYQRNVYDEEPFSLPEWEPGHNVEIELAGQIAVTEVSIAGDCEELAQV